MARIVNSIITPIVSLNVRTMFKDGTYSDSSMKKDDIVTDLRYISDNVMHKITGRVSDISYKMSNTKRMYTNVSKSKSYFSVDVTPISIFIDKSTVQHSDVVEIPVREIVENEGVLNVQRMKTWLSYGLHSIVTLTDGTINDIILYEGQIVEDFVYLNGTEIPVTAKIVAIRYDKYLNPASVVTMIDGKLNDISVKKIKSVGKVIDTVSTTTDIQDLINTTTETDVYLADGLFNTQLDFKKDISIKGSKAGIRATAKTRDVVTFKDETVISGALKITSDVKVSFDGVVLTKDAVLSLGNAKEVELKNCIITELVPVSSGSCVITTGNTPTKLNISGCYFGANAKTTTSFKNTLELNAKIMDGSIFENNYFAKDCARNNDICIYDVSDNANIIIRNNEWEESGNGVRVGTKGDAVCTIDIYNNTYRSTLRDQPEYAGLLLVQPYGKQTTNMSRVKINISKTTHYDKLQLYYLYSGTNDMPFTSENMPTITVDDEKQDLTKYISK